MPTFRTLATTTTVATAAVVALCPAAASAAAPAGRAPVRVHTSHGRVVAPASIAPGRTALHNSGSVGILAVQPRAHHGAADLVRDMNSAGPGRVLRDFTIVAALQPHNTVITYVGRGRVFLLSGPTSVDKVTTVRVTGARRDAVVPDALPVILDAGNRLHLPAALPTRGVLRVRNDSPRADEVLALRVGDSVSQATVDQVVAHPSEQGLEALQPTDASSFPLVAPHRRAWMTYSLPAGRWVLVVVPLGRLGAGFPHAGQFAATTVGG